MNHHALDTNTINRESKYEKLRKSRFKQQRLPAWRPVPTITSTTIIYFTIGVLCIGLGIVVLLYSNDITEIILRYDEDCGTSTNCILPFGLNKTMKGPIMVYYQLNNFYQNHRRLLKSKSDRQLKGKNLTVDEVRKDCDPIVSNEDGNYLYGLDDQNLYLNDTAIPCGLMAKSYFTDQYELQSKNKTHIEIDETNISWVTDRAKFNNTKNDTDPEFWRHIQWIDMTNEHFIVWMRPAAYPNFRKLWGRIYHNLEEGDYIININNTYDITSFHGEKYFILSTSNIFGGKNDFIGITYIAIGCGSFMIGIGFLLWHFLHKNKKISID